DLRLLLRLLLRLRRRRGRRRRDRRVRPPLLALAPRALRAARPAARAPGPVGRGPRARRAVAAGALLAGLRADEPLLGREHGAPRRARLRAGGLAQEAGLDRELRDAQRLEHAVGRVLERVGQDAVPVEHPQDAVDL